MSHRYALGDLLVSRPPAIPPGPYVIVRQLPSEDGEPHYYARCTIDGHERALTEGQLSPAPRPKPAEAVDRRKERRRAWRS
jgi:hypothetical protein